MSKKLFDPTEAPYGRCRTCGIEIQTRHESGDHLVSTMQLDDDGVNRSHTVRVENPDRKSRIENEIASLLEDSLQAFYSEVESLVARNHITEDEATDAISTKDVDLIAEWEAFCE